MDSISINKGISEQDIQSLLNKINQSEGVTATMQTAADVSKGFTVTLSNGLETKMISLDFAPEIDDPTPMKDAAKTLDEVAETLQKLVDSLKDGGPVLNSGKPAPGSVVSDFMFSVQDILLLVQKTLQALRKDGQQLKQADHQQVQKMKQNEAETILRTGETSYKFAMINAGIQTGMTALSTTFAGVGAVKTFQSYKNSGVSTATDALKGVQSDLDAANKMKLPTENDGMELTDMDQNGASKALNAMKNTNELRPSVMESKGQFHQAKLRLAQADKGVADAEKLVETRMNELETVKNDPKSDSVKISDAEKGLSEAQKSLDGQKQLQGRLKAEYENKADGHAKLLKDYKTAMDKDIKSLRDAKKPTADIENAEKFRNQECNQSHEDLKEALTTSFDKCQRELDVAVGRFTNGAEAQNGRKWEAFTQLSKSFGDSISGFVSGTGSQKEAQEKRSEKLYESEEERARASSDSDRDLVEALKESLQQVNQMRMSIMDLDSRAVDNILKG